MKYLKKFENLYKENVRGRIMYDEKSEFSIACVFDENGKEYILKTLGRDDEGYPEVGDLDTKEIDGRGRFSRKSIKPYIGMKVRFTVSTTGYGYNFTIKKEDN